MGREPSLFDPSVTTTWSILDSALASSLRKASEGPQIEELINASKGAVFFIDDDQVVRPGEIGSSDYIRDFAQEKKWQIYEYKFEAQF